MQECGAQLIDGSESCSRESLPNRTSKKKCKTRPGGDPSNIIDQPPPHSAAAAQPRQIFWPPLFTESAVQTSFCFRLASFTNNKYLPMTETKTVLTTYRSTDHHRAAHFNDFGGEFSNFGTSLQNHVLLLTSSEKFDFLLSVRSAVTGSSCL